MTSVRTTLAKSLRQFLTEAKRQSAASPKRLLRALRTVALEDAEDKPNSVPLDEVVRLASQLAARATPIQILDQKLHATLLWNLFQQLSQAGLGKEWRGRRGSKTRFSFSHRLTNEDIRQVFDDLDLASATSPIELPAGEEEASQNGTKASMERVRLDRDRVLSLLGDQGEELRRLGVLSLSLFGSVARNEAGAKSDVDLLVTFREPITSDAFFATKFFLEDLLGCRVDLITESALRDRVRRVIEPELVRVA